MRQRHQCPFRGRASRVGLTAALLFSLGACSSLGASGPSASAVRSAPSRGLGNAESFSSAPHGAGRRMSRGEARRRFTAEDLVCQTEGVECRKDARVVDEIPGAYKPLEEVLEKSRDLVEPIAGLRQIICVKG